MLKSAEARYAAGDTSLNDVLPASLTGISASCVLTGGGSCGTNASAGQTVAFSAMALNQVVGSKLVITINATLALGTTGTLSHTANVVGGAGYNDPQPGNNSAIFSVSIAADAVFANGFED